jgi:hypothetical protein
MAVDRLVFFKIEQKSNGERFELKYLPPLEGGKLSTHYIQVRSKRAR